MNDNKSYPKLHMTILAIQIVLLASTLVMNLYFYHKNLQLQLSSRRADVSVFANWYQYLMTEENLTLTVRGEVHNEGPRATIVKNFRIGIKYAPGSDNEIQFAHILSGAFAQMLGWQNLALATEEGRTFAVTESYSLADYPKLINVKPEEGWITVFHDDGVGIQEQTRTFSLEFFP